jgi:hypothetical protein
VIGDAIKAPTTDPTSGKEKMRLWLLAVKTYPSSSGLPELRP